MNNQYQNQFDAMDMLSVISLIIGYSNLIENRQQSAQNDVNAANDRQAQQILSEIGARLDKQDAVLDKQDAMLNQILEAIKNGSK